MAVSVALAPLRRCQPLDARGRALVTFAILSLAYLVGADDEFVGAGQSSWRNLIGQDPVPSDADFDFEYFHGRHLALSYTFTDLVVLSHDTYGIEYGYSVAANRSLAAVGAPADYEFGPSAGAVFVFVATSNVTWSWSFVAKLYPVYNSPPRFGTSVAVCESTGTVVASATGNDTETRGAVHVFTMTEKGNWLLRQVLWGFSDTEGYGLHVVMVADVMAVAAPYADAHAGAVYLYHRMQGGGFEFMAKLSPEAGAPGDLFGSALTLYKGSPFRLLVGAPGRNDSRGAAIMFLVDPAVGHWNESDTFVSPDSRPGDRFGTFTSGYVSKALMDNIAISGVISHDNLNTSGYISVYAFDNSTWLLTDTVSIRSGSAFLGATGPIVPTAFSLRAGVLWIAATLYRNQSPDSAMYTGLFRFLPSPFNATWYLAQVFSMGSLLLPPQKAPALSVADLSGTLFLGTDMDIVTTVTWVPPSSTPSPSATASVSESSSPSAFSTPDGSASTSPAPLPSVTRTRTPRPNTMDVIFKALEISNVDAGFLQVHPDYSKAFMDGVRQDLSRVTSLPADAFVVNGVATMAASVIVEYTIDTRPFGIPATAASNLIDSLLSSNMLLLTVIINVLPAEAFLGPVAAGDASFLRCVDYFSANGTYGNVTGPQGPLQDPLHSGLVQTGHTTTQLVVVAAVPTIALLLVSTMWCWRLQQDRKSAAAVKAASSTKDCPCKCKCTAMEAWQESADDKIAYFGVVGACDVTDVGSDPVAPAEIVALDSINLKLGDDVRQQGASDPCPAFHAADGLLTPTAPLSSTALPCSVESSDYDAKCDALPTYTGQPLQVFTGTPYRPDAYRKRRIVLLPPAPSQQ